jgi:hypothetical protein
MVDYKYSELYKQESIDKQLNIAFNGGNITNEDIHSEQFELTESLCSGAQLRFGSCEASMIKFRISNIFTPLKDKWLTVTEILNHNTDTPFQFGKYKVYYDTPTADRRYRDVVAYDQMYDIINADLTDWYNSLFQTDDTEVTLKEFRDSLMNYLGVEQEDVTLVNDDMVIKKTIQPTQLAGRDVVSAICEINGCFGHIGRDGKFHYVFLPKYTQGLYPSNDLYPKDDLYPRESSANKIDNSLYISCKYEDYLSQRITKLQIRQETNDIGKTYPDSNITDSDNVYAVQGNFLVYGKEQDELYEIAKNLFLVIADTEYRPYNAEIVGNPCLEVGDAIRINTKYQIVESYILKRTLKGVQGLRDSFSADGDEYLSENASGIESQIEQLRGKSNVLERDIEHTMSKIEDVESGLTSKIEQTADSITQTVSSSQSKWDTSGYDSTKIYVGYEDVQDKTVEEGQSVYNYYLNSNTGYLYEQVIGGVVPGHDPYKIWSKKDELRKVEDNIYSQIEQTSSSITSIVSSSQSKWDTSGYSDYKIYIGNSDVEEKEISSEQSAYDYYLNTNTGYLYIKASAGADTVWTKYAELQKVEEVLQSSIEQTAENIIQTVSATQSKWDDSVYVNAGYTPEYGCGEPTSTPASSNQYYLDVTSGWMYKGSRASAGYEWVKHEQLKKVKDVLSSEIEQTAESITSTVAKTTKIWSIPESELTNIKYFGYSEPTIENPTINSAYLDQENGWLYVYHQTGQTTYGWVHEKSYDSIEETLSSRIEQTISSISLEINNGDKTAGIVITLENEDGSTSEVKGTIEMTGMVTFNDLKGEGQTVINGSNITTGTIDAEKVNVINVVAKSVAAENITGHTISGKTINGGVVKGSTIYSDYILYMYKKAYSALEEPSYAKALQCIVRDDPVSTTKSYNYLDVGRGFDGIHIPIDSTIGYSNSYMIRTLRDSTDLGNPYMRVGRIDFFNTSSPYIKVYIPTLDTSYGITVNASDTRLKKNIEETKKTAIDKIKQMEFIQFDWKSNDKHVPLGLSANQLETIIPEAVYDVPQEDNSEYDSLKNVNTTTLLNYALKAIQEQQEVIENQQKEIDQLKKSVSFLMQKIGGGADE